MIDVSGQNYKLDFNRYLPLKANLALMKYILLLFAFPLFSQAQIPADSARYHKGEMITVCGNVFAVLSPDNGPATISFGESYKNNPFTAIIFPVDIKKFKDLEATCLHKKVCVTGWVTMHLDKPQIILTEANQLVSADK
jgi:hypothetical protein